MRQDATETWHGATLGDGVREAAADLLRDIADGRPIEPARCHALAEAVLDDEVVTAAVRVREADERFLLRRAIELAGLVLAMATTSACRPTKASDGE